MTSVSADRRQGVNSSAAIKVPVRVATTANIVLTGLQTIDGVALASLDRVLVKDQTNAIENGIYDVDTGNWTRSIDFDGAYDLVEGTIVTVLHGTIYTGTLWRVFTTTPAIGSAIAFIQSSLSPADSNNVQFLQSGAGAVARSEQDKGRDIVNGRDFANANGVQIAGDDLTDDNVGLQRLLNRGGRIVLGGGKTYRNAAANLTMIANTDLVIERGTTLHLVGKRLWAHAVNNISITGGGIIKSTALDNAVDPDGSGIVEFHGTAGTSASFFTVRDIEVFGDWVGAPGDIIVAGNDKRKGITLLYCDNVLVEHCEVSGIVAEAISHMGDASDVNVKIQHNYVHDCNHDGLNGNEGTTNDVKWIHNYVADCFGIECSGGQVLDNTMVNCGFSIGGGGVAPGQMTIKGNRATGGGFSCVGGVVASPFWLTDLILEDNISINASATAFDVEYLRSAVIRGNKAYGWGADSSAVAFLSTNVGDIYASDNLAANEDAGSTGGGFNFNGTHVFHGINVAYGTTRPWPGVGVAGRGFHPAKLPTFSQVAPTSHTGDTNSFAFGTYTVLANHLRDAAGFEAKFGGTCTNNANAKTLNIAFGATTVITVNLASVANWRAELEVMNTGDANTQAYSYIAWGGTAVLAVGSGTLTEATTADKALVSAITLANAGDTVTQNIMLVKALAGFIQ